MAEPWPEILTRSNTEMANDVVDVQDDACAVHGLPTRADKIDLLGTPEGRDVALEKVLPVPFPIGENELADASWIPSLDTLSEQLTAIRRFGRFRAYHDSGEFNADEVHRDSRLIGRSVWNRRWLLIIPASTLSSDREEGLARFIEGNLVGDERDGNGVSDIKLFFETYAFPRLKKDRDVEETE